MADTWDPDEYSDDYVKALMKVIEAKAEGEGDQATDGRPAGADQRRRSRGAAAGEPGGCPCRHAGGAQARSGATEAGRQAQTTGTEEVQGGLRCL